MFQMASGLSALKKLVDALGSSRDTVDHRHRISEANLKLQDTAKRIKEKLTALGHDKASMPAPAQQKVRRLMQDFGAMLQDYKGAQKLAAEREATSLPRVAAGAAAGGGGGSGGREAELERQGLLQQQAMEEARLLDSAMTFNETLIEERDHGIQGEA